MFNTKYKERIKELECDLKQEQEFTKSLQKAYEDVVNSRDNLISNGITNPQSGYTAEIEAERDKMKFVFELNLVFCVERTHIGTSNEHTILAYGDPTKRLKEWHLYCSRKNHNEMADKFTKLLK